MRLENGDIVVAHCPNTGSMRASLQENAPAVLSFSNDPKRKTRYSWKAIRISRTWVGIDTMLPNRLVEAAIRAGEIPALQGYEEIVREPVLSAHSRADLLLQGAGRCYVEVKNVTLVENGVARFPDAVTLRGQKHLMELLDKVRHGDRAAMVFLVQRSDGKRFRPADDIDLEYGRILRQVAAKGVEIFALSARVRPEGVESAGLLPVDFSKGLP